MNLLLSRMVAGACFLSFAVASPASESITFTKDILPILQSRCQDCHRPEGVNYGGMVAPMSLMTYEEVRPWAKSIQRQVQSREMPPWDAAAKYNGLFANERTLTDEQIDLISRWVAQGSPQGNPADAPPPREFAGGGGWLHGPPDLVLTIPAAYVITDEMYDQYTQFTIDLTNEQLLEDRYIRAFQCKPGVKIIHHFNAHLLYPDENGKLPPPPDQHESSALAPVGAGMYIGGVSSGTDANIYPEGYGLLLKKGTRVTFDIHYHKDPGPGTGVTDDKSQIGFYFTKAPPKAPVVAVSMMNFNIHIAPGENEYVIGPVSRPIQQDSKIIALMPHMHMRGKRAKFEVTYPDGKQETLLEVPGYDFNWQTVYYYREMKALPKGSQLAFTAWYDNSEEYGRLRNFDWNQPVKYGQKSTDEMMMGFVMTAPAVGE